MMQKKLFVLAGEVSGDLHAAGVVRELLSMHPGLEVFGTGGGRLRRLGARLLYDTDDLSVMGLTEVLRHAFFLRTVIRNLKQEIRREKPTAALLVDYPAMNLHMARFLHDEGISVIYYISPKVWAWKERRVKAIRRYVDRLLVIFRFEVEFFARHGVRAEYVGNPVAEEVGELEFPDRSVFCRKHGIDPSSRLVGMLPGSRRQEVSRIYPEMVSAARLLSKRHQIVFLLGRAPQMPRELYDSEGIGVIECSAYDVMHYSDAAMVTSGTATLEALCFGLPMVVVYKTGWLNYAVGKRLVRLHNISLANILSRGLYASAQLVPELLQDEAEGSRIAAAVSSMLDDEACAGAVRSELLAVRDTLLESSPSKKAAAVVSSYLE
ncbi:MAG: lipid-A-disaccharide synthase [Prosthecochloris sp.]|nr:lipid-A-disaccharide synthase [Prosthecochloris sp.]